MERPSRRPELSKRRKLPWALQSGGQVKRIIADEGQIVRTGDTLLIIDDTDWRYQLDQASGGYEMAEAQYRLALKGAREEDIIQAEASFKKC